MMAAIAVAASLLFGSSQRVNAQRDAEEQGSHAYARHQEALGLADKEGPASYADQVAELNAYPAASITADEITGAQAAFDSIKGRGFGRGKHSTSSWFSLGPTSETYPSSLNRHGSVYPASGRITALAMAPTCDKSSCTTWVAAAGGGVWRTDKALSGNPNWINVSDGFFKSSAIGALTYDAAHHTLYAGTGEDAAAGDAEAGVGIYKSTDNGDTWTALGGNANFANRAIQRIAVDPHDSTGQTLYVADGRGVHGISSTTAGAVSQVPGAPGVGIWKSTDGGATFTLLAPRTVVLGPNPGQTFPSSFGSTRGATQVAVDPTHSHVIYAGAYNVGVWRSLDDGATWTNIHPCAVDPLVTDNTSPFFGTCGAAADRSEFTLVTTPDGHTRIYQTEGDSGPPTVTDAQGNRHKLGDRQYSRFFVANAVESGSPSFTDKTSAGLTFHTDSDGNIVADPSSPGYATYDFCTGQCWYDQGVYSPPEQPNTVYVFGSFTYAEAPDLSQSGFHTLGGPSNGRAVLLSQDGGNTFTDVTEDATSATAPNGLHPDQHALVTIPGKPLQFLEGSDGGLMLSDGTLKDISSRCDGRGLSTPDLGRCHQLLSAVPGQYTDLNEGLQTLQFQALSVNPADSKDVQGGTQDNGTMETHGGVRAWPQTIYGDGGMNGFDASNAHFRLHAYFGQQPEVSFGDGAPSTWDFIGDPLFAESALFYFPVITDPTVSGTMYSGLTHVWRTLDSGGNQALLDQHCNEFTGDTADVSAHPTSDFVCGDWVRVGDPSASGRLTCSPAVSTQPNCMYGTTRAGGNVSWLSRSPSDDSTLWAATTTGRLFVSHNANAGSPTAVTFTRIDTLAANSPGRAISDVYVDPRNSNHAWASYLGYNATTPNQAGHLFSVTYNPVAGTATWTMLDNAGSSSFGDQPANALVEDPNTSDLYAATDFGVVKLAADDTATGWVLAADNLPVVTVAGMTINPAARQLLAATHGRGAYQLTLP
jgi:hypothetical protein